MRAERGVKRRGSAIFALVVRCNGLRPAARSGAIHASQRHFWQAVCYCMLLDGIVCFVIVIA